MRASYLFALLFIAACQSSTLPAGNDPMCEGSPPAGDARCEPQYICNDQGEWELVEELCYPGECPVEAPAAGDLCDIDPSLQCSYDVATPCGPQQMTLTCASDGLGASWWQVASLPVCQVDPEQCQQYGDGALCDADPGCRWLLPGCGGGPTVPTGCYPVGDCDVIGCDAWAGCLMGIDHDPCWNSSCDACGSTVNVCVPLP